MLHISHYVTTAAQADDTYQQYLFWFGCIEALHTGDPRRLRPLPHAQFKAYHAYWASQVYRYLMTGLTNRVPGTIIKHGCDVQIERAVGAAPVGL